MRTKAQPIPKKTAPPPSVRALPVSPRIGWLFCLILAARAFPQGYPDRDAFRAGDGVFLSAPMDTSSVVNKGYPIDAQGYADLPVAGRIRVVDKTPREVEALVSKSLGPYLREPYVQVRPAVRLLLVGHWQHPGMHYVNAEASVWEAARTAGGPAGEVNLKKWIIMRGDRNISNPILDAFSRGSTLREAGVLSGDIFLIPVPNPQTGFWYWLRESLTATAQITSIIAALATVYLTYLIYEDQH